MNFNMDMLGHNQPGIMKYLDPCTSLLHHYEDHSYKCKLKILLYQWLKDNSDVEIVGTSFW